MKTIVRAAEAASSPDPEAREQAAHALTAFDDAARLVCGAPREPSGREASGAASRRIDPRALEAVCRLDDLTALFEGMLGWDAAALGPYDAATIIWCLSRPALRDIALVGWCGGADAGAEALQAQLRWEAGAEYPPHLAMHMWGEGERPDPDRLRRALALVAAVAALAPDERRAGPLATAAWLSWALGFSADAARCAREACAHEPEHGLAEIVLSFLAAGHRPDWRA